MPIAKKRRPKRLGERRKEQAGDDQAPNAAIAAPAQGEQGEAEDRVDQEHVARPEQHRVDEADDEEKRQPARVQLRRAMRPRARTGPGGMRSFGGREPLHLQREADAEDAGRTAG